jgi:pimeloyl-ACP methyl ester carboxylesterase
MEPQPASQLPDGVSSRFVQAGDLRTHYLEAAPAGDPGAEPIVLVHSAEFGGRAEFSWRYNIAELGSHFRVYASDMAGFGRTDMVYNFSDPVGFRIRHLRRFLETLCVGPAHFIGNSFGGGLVLQLAAEPEWGIKVRSAVVVSGGGKAPDNDARKILTGYNGRREEMREILRVLFYDERWCSDDVVEERWRASREPGAWEACAAARLAPEGEARGFRPLRPEYGKIRCPVLIVAGAQDLLRFPTYAEEMQKQIAGSTVRVFDRARHCSHIEHAEAFNRMVIDFLNKLT